MLKKLWTSLFGKKSTGQEVPYKIDSPTTTLSTPPVPTKPSVAKWKIENAQKGLDTPAPAKKRKPRKPSAAKLQKK